MTRQEMEFVRYALDSLDFHARLYEGYSDIARENTKKALELLDYEIDLMCADEAERNETPAMCEMKYMEQLADELFEAGLELCRKMRAA